MVQRSSSSDTDPNCTVSTVYREAILKLVSGYLLLFGHSELLIVGAIYHYDHTLSSSTVIRLPVVACISVDSVLASYNRFA